MVLGALVFGFAGSLFASPGYYRLRNGERIPPKGWFRFANEMLRRQRYSDPSPRWPASQLPSPGFAMAVGLLFIAAGVFLLLNAAFS
jgi:hypothetical protein